MSRVLADLTEVTSITGLANATTCVRVEFAEVIAHYFV